MTTAVFSFYASDFHRDDFEECVKEGVIMGAEGRINLRWEDFSAVEVAGEIGLHDVVWDAVKDNSPGTLALTVLYPALTALHVAERLRRQDWITAEL